MKQSAVTDREKKKKKKFKPNLFNNVRKKSLSIIPTTEEGSNKK